MRPAAERIGDSATLGGRATALAEAATPPRSKSFPRWRRTRRPSPPNRYRANGISRDGKTVLGVGCWVLGVGCWVLGVRSLPNTQHLIPHYRLQTAKCLAAR